MTSHSPTTPLLLKEDGLTAPYAKAMASAHWARVDRWEQTPLRSDGHPVWPPTTRGEWVDGVLNDLLEVCAQHGQTVTDTQALRDDVFDMIRAQSRK
jgi:hypothetical protein